MLLELGHLFDGEEKVHVQQDDQPLVDPPHPFDIFVVDGESHGRGRFDRFFVEGDDLGDVLHDQPHGLPGKVGDDNPGLATLFDRGQAETLGLSITGMMRRRRLITPSMKGRVFGSLVTACIRSISWMDWMSIP